MRRCGVSLSLECDFFSYLVVVVVVTLILFFFSSSLSFSFFFFLLFLLFSRNSLSSFLPPFPQTFAKMKKKKKTYLCIVRNKILVDVQGEDLLYQIFTSTVLQRVAGQEAPFLEFIQRVCSCETNEDGELFP